MASVDDDAVIDRYQIAAELFKNMPEGFPYENYDLEDIEVPEGDDMGIPDVNDAGDEEDVETESGFGSLIGKDAHFLCQHSLSKQRQISLQCMHKRQTERTASTWSAMEHVPTIAPAL